MKVFRGMCAIAMCCSTVGAYAMDGVCIATILNYASFKWETSFGPLVKYEIVADTIAKVDTLVDVDAASPRINMSGTYYAYLKAVNKSDNTQRSLVIKPLYGNPTKSVEIPLQKGATWIWWVQDSSFFYTQNPGTGQYYVRKVKLSRVNGQLVATDRMWTKTQKMIQGGFVGMDLTGTHLSYKEVTNTFCCTVTGDSTVPPVNVNTGIFGCGNGVSPSGEWWSQFPGGHGAVGWGKWDNTNIQGVGYPTMDSLWAITQGSDPMRNLEVHPILWGLSWMPCPIGVFGMENIWSQNSEDWFMTEVGAALTSYDGDCVNAVAMNFRTKKAINVSKIVPTKQTMLNDKSQAVCEFRYKVTGPTFTNAVQRSADRPGLWCSTQADVWAPLWHYIQNRQLDNQQWSDLLGLPLSQITASSVRAPQAKSAGPRLAIVKGSRSSHTLMLPTSSRFTVTIANLAGRAIVRTNASGREFNLPPLEAGTYVVTACQTGKTFSAKIAVN